MYPRREKKISIVFNNGIDLNPGRASEHLAFDAIAARHGYTNLQYFELVSPEDYYTWFKKLEPKYPQIDLSSIRTSYGEFYEGFPIKYDRLLGRLDELAASDAIIYWSDWLHLPCFYEHYKQCLPEMSIAKDEHEAIELVNSHIFLTDQSDEVLDKTISFGQTIMYNTLRHETTPDYGAAYQSFYKRARKAYMRDVFSARKISRLRSDYDNNNACVDCAMLLRDEDVDRMSRSASDEDLAFCRHKIGVFFGRSDIDVEDIHSVVETLSEELKKPAFWLPWGLPSIGFPQTKSLPFPTPSGGSRRFIKVGDSLSMIRCASAVITDTYHVCVNAWARGVPAICVGSILAKGEFDLNSGYRFSSIDKRYSLYEMLEALDFYVHEEELRDAEFLKAHLRSIAGLINTPAFMQQIRSGLRAEAAAAEDRLVRELDGILGSTSQAERRATAA
ncbi:MAG: hypothetical protein ACJ8R9_21670 [Steroidobacteraceae bacterium]